MCFPAHWTTCCFAHWFACDAVQETLLDPSAAFSEAARMACHSPPASAVVDMGDDRSAESPCSGAGMGVGAGAADNADDAGAFQPVSKAKLSEERVAVAPAASTADPSPRAPAQKRKAPPSPTSPDTVLDVPTTDSPSGGYHPGLRPNVAPMQSIDAC